MSDVSAVFTKKYESEVAVEYQQQSSLMRSTVRVKTAMGSEAVKFPWLGKIDAAQKGRNGKVPTSNVEHKSVEVKISDYYAAATIDEQDLDKLNFDARRPYVELGASALGRKADQIIIAAMSAGQTTDKGGNTQALDLAFIRKIISSFNKALVPDDGKRFCAVGADQWETLMSFDEFVKSDYVGDSYPLLRGVENRKWRNINWFVVPELPKPVATATTCFLYHQNAVGIAESRKVTSKIEYRIDYDDYFCMNKMGMGAGVIDAAGVLKFTVKDAFGG
nr:MAG TPA: major capsid protein [Caudoviricetes sp.]